VDREHGMPAGERAGAEAGTPLLGDSPAAPVFQAGEKPGKER